MSLAFYISLYIDKLHLQRFQRQQFLMIYPSQLTRLKAGACVLDLSQPSFDFLKIYGTIGMKEK